MEDVTIARIAGRGQPLLHLQRQPFMPLRMSVRRMPATREPRSDRGSSPRQRRDDSRRQSRRHRSGIPHEGVAREFDLDVGHSGTAEAFNQPAPPALSESRRGRRPRRQLVNQTRRHVGLTRHVSHYRTGPEMPPLKIACLCATLHRRRRRDPTNTSTLAINVSCTGANTGVCTMRNPPPLQTGQRKAPIRRMGTACGQWLGRGSRLPGGVDRRCCPRGGVRKAMRPK